MSPADIPIIVILICAGSFLALGIFYPFIADWLNVDEGRGEHRLFSILIGLALATLVFVYRLATQSLAN